MLSTITWCYIFVLAPPQFACGVVYLHMYYVSVSFSLPLSLLYVHIAIDYILYMRNQALKQQEQLRDLEKEVQALRIMKE